MKLKVGKLYRCRDDKLYKYARVDAIRPEAELGPRRVAITWFNHKEIEETGSVGINGKFFPSAITSDKDLIEEYEEPKFIVNKEGWYLTDRGEEVEVLLPHAKKDSTYPVLVVYGGNSTWFVTKLGVRHGQKEDRLVKYLRPREGQK